MRFPLDPGDTLGDGCWETLKRVLALVSTLWLGCIAALIAYYFAQVASAVWAGAWGDLGEIILEMGEAVLWSLLWAPFYLLFSLWGIVLLPLMGVVMLMMFRADKNVTWFWFSAVVGSGVMAMNGFIELPLVSALRAVAWVIFLLVMVSLAAGCWLFHGWQQNSQAAHLQEVMAENELRRLEIEQQYGTTSFGQGNVQEMDDDS
ncbi:MAG: hypothetical protein P8O22_06685 [Akkermansiaceae bacterium]|nr:hypothetical protein [Akkermansiaceae bacterium]